MAYQIESRWLKWAKWRKVLSSPHGEKRPFNNKYELEFNKKQAAQDAMESLKIWNDAEYRLIENAD